MIVLNSSSLDGRRASVAASASSSARARFRVADDADVGRQTDHLGRIDVDADHLDAGRNFHPAKVLQLEPGADADQHIGIEPWLDGGTAGKPVRRVLAHNAAAAAVRGHRRLQKLREFQHLGAGMHRAAAHGDHRILRVVQQGDSARDRLRIGFRRRHVLHRHIEVGHPLGAEHVPRRLDRHRPDAAGGQVPERLAHDRGGLAGMVDALRPFRESAQDSQLVRQFVQNAAAAADVLGLDVAGDAQHRRVGAVGGAQRGAGVEHARTRHAGEDADAAGGLGVAVGHVARALLVPVDDEAYLVAGLVQRVDEIVGVRTRYAEDRVDAVAYQRCGDHLPGAQSF